LSTAGEIRSGYKPDSFVGTSIDLLDLTGGLREIMRQRRDPYEFGGAPPLSTLLANDELPLSVREASTYLGVSVQTVYLWVERKQIPHLRVMGRNIRFLKSDLENFRASFKQVVNSGAA